MTDDDEFERGFNDAAEDEEYGRRDRTDLLGEVDEGGYTVSFWSDGALVTVDRDWYPTDDGDHEPRRHRGDWWHRR